LSDAKTILLVDDEVHILSALSRSLRREGWEILTAAGADEALAILEERGVDLVVSDHKMPGGRSGLDLLAAVGELRPGARRVLLTGWPEQIPAKQLAEFGLDAVMPKPWEDAEMKAILRGLLENG
jgi:DNA-binding NtrC family response regulator